MPKAGGWPLTQAAFPAREGKDRSWFVAADLQVCQWFGRAKALQLRYEATVVPPTVRLPSLDFGAIIWAIDKNWRGRLDPVTETAGLGC